METYLAGLILESLKTGDIKSALAFVMVFMILWLELRGLKKQFVKMNGSLSEISSALKIGEKRFENIEKDVKDIDYRIIKIEDFTKTIQMGDNNAKSL